MVFIDFLIKRFRLIGLMIILALCLHELLGKPRWQYYPIYMLGILYFILITLNISGLLDLSPNLAKWTLWIIALLLLSSIFFIQAFPVEKLPRPSGEFEIGTKIYDLEDKSRDETYSEEKNQKRKIKYQIWYPAEKTDGYKKAKWISDGKTLTRQLAKNMHMLFFMLDHTAEIDSNSYYGAPINNSLDKYPIVIISHGWKGFRELHTDYAEELASNGFIAVSIDHTYGSQAVKFKDGSLAYISEKALPREVDPSKYDENSNKLVRTYGEDVASLLDDLERLNREDDNLKTSLDLESIGLLGHSTGGAGHVYISQKDRRVKALLGLDPWVNPIKIEELEKGLAIPSLLIRSQQWSIGPNNKGLNALVENSEKATLMQLNKTNHVDFSMSYMYSPLSKYIGFTGKLGGRKSSEIQREIILHFFNETLRSDKLYNKDYLLKIEDKYKVIDFIK